MHAMNVTWFGDLFIINSNLTKSEKFAKVLQYFTKLPQYCKILQILQLHKIGQILQLHKI